MPPMSVTADLVPFFVVFEPLTYRLIESWIVGHRFIMFELGRV